MQIAEAIRQLQEIQKKYGNIPIVGGYLTDDRALSKICVINEEGVEVFPRSHERPGEQRKIDGVFLS